jgi:hypothetical protein
VKMRRRWQIDVDAALFVLSMFAVGVLVAAVVAKAFL